jgi:hypothetical protein
MESKFVNYMEHHRIKFEANPEYKKYREIQRAFRNVYSPKSFDHLVYIHESGESINEGMKFEIHKLIGYLYSKNIMTNSEKEFQSFGKSLSDAHRKPKFLQSIISSDFDRLIVQIKNLAGLYSSEDVKINPYHLFDLLISWNAQTKGEIKNWCRNRIINDFYLYYKE